MKNLTRMERRHKSPILAAKTGLHKPVPNGIFLIGISVSIGIWIPFLEL